MAKQTYNRIYTPERWEKVNKYNKQLLDDYILQIRSEGKSEKSIKQYYNDARIILIYIMEELDNKQLYRLNRKALRNFVLWMQDNGMSATRINRMLSTTRNLFNFVAEDDDYEEDFEDCKVNPNRLKGLRKEKARDLIFLTNEEVMSIYNSLVKQERYSEALLCAFLYDSSCRRNEAFQVTREDISIEANFTKNEVTGKRGKKFRLIYHQLTKEAYALYMEHRNDEEQHLWETRHGGPAAYETLYNQIVSWRKILLKEMGVEKEFNPHSFRHSSLNNYENGTHYMCEKLGKKFTLQELQLLANHSDISTTMSYLEDKSTDKLLEAFGM